VSHGNLVANQRMIHQIFQGTRESIVLGWLPLYHDMGLIWNVLQTLWMRARCILSRCCVPAASGTLARGDLEVPRDHQWRSRLRVQAMHREDHERTVLAFFEADALFVGGDAFFAANALFRRPHEPIRFDDSLPSFG